MVGTTPLVRSLPARLEDTLDRSPVMKDDEDGDWSLYEEVDGENMVSVAGMILSMFSISLTTSSI